MDLTDITRPVTAAALMRLLPAPRPRVLALGEPTHGEEKLLALRNDLFRELVEQEGYVTIAVESDCLLGLAVDDHVTSGEGSLDEVMAGGFSHTWFNASQANRELVRWMRERNAGRAAAEQVRFAGFDGPVEMEGAASPRRALLALHGHLAARVAAELMPCTAEELDLLLGPDERWTEPAAMTDPARSVGRSADAGRLRLLADDLVALLDAQAPHLRATSTPEEWERARLYARTATGLLRYHHWTADPSPARMARLCAGRALMMAGNLLALAARGPVLVHAHNSHLQRQLSALRMWQGPVEWWGAGALLSARLGEGYAFVAAALGTLPHHGVDVPPPDTSEGMLYALPADRALVDPVRLAAAEPRPVPRVSPWFGYAPLDPDHLPYVDALAYVRDVVRTRDPAAGG